MSRSNAACALLLLFSLAAVVVVRVQPLYLGVLQETAERIVTIRPESVDAAAQRLKARYTFVGADGKEHVYLGDLDSYLWLRHARTLLRTGSPCDQVVDGVCRDALTNAPRGAASPYARSLHVTAIARLHQVITLIAPAFPLEVTSFFVPVIVAAFGVLPAFFIARRLSGSDVAGPFAVVIASLHAVVLARTLGSDSDIWNVVLPLYALWAVIAAVSATTSRRRWLMAVLAALCIGLQAWAWRGWLFAYTVLLLGFAGAALVRALRYGALHRTVRVWRAPGLAGIAIVLLIFYAVTGLTTTLAGSEQSYLTIPAKAVGAVLSSASSPPAASSGAGLDWPSAFASVGELRPMQLVNVGNVIGRVLLLCGLAGLIVLFLPERWGRVQVVVFVIGTAWYLGCLYFIEPDRLPALALLAAPLIAALSAGDEGGDTSTVRLVAACAIGAWFLGAIYLSAYGVRYLFLLAPPLGLACAVLAGRMHVAVSRLIKDSVPWYRGAVSAMLTIVLLLALFQPLRAGYDAAKDVTPAMHDGWWDTLTNLRDHSSPDAIVHAQWDYGHWIKYVADRRVSNDGSSLATHIPFWMARAFAAPTEAESRGILRMLSCGSDGADDALIATGRDPATAYGLLSEIIGQARNAAARVLAARGLATPAAEAVLRLSHCDPPESFLLLTSALTAERASWIAMGLQDPRRAGPADPTAHDAFLPQWMPCTAAPTGDALTCPIQKAIAPGMPVLSAFTYSASAPETGTLRGQSGQSPEGDSVAADLVIAGEREIRNVVFPASRAARTGVLIDVPNRRILLGAPSFIASTFVRLMYLDARYSPHFVKFDERREANERVATWKIDWRD